MEYDSPLLPHSTDFGRLRTSRHDPDECSRRVGYQDKLDGAQRMVEIAVEHLIERGSFAGEIAEIRTVLSDRVMEVLR